MFRLPGYSSSGASRSSPRPQASAVSKEEGLKGKTEKSSLKGGFGSPFSRKKAEKAEKNLSLTPCRSTDSDASELDTAFNDFVQDINKTLDDLLAITDPVMGEENVLKAIKSSEPDISDLSLSPSLQKGQKEQMRPRTARTPRIGIRTPRDQEPVTRAQIETPRRGLGQDLRRTERQVKFDLSGIGEKKI